MRIGDKSIIMTVVKSVKSSDNLVAMAGDKLVG